MANQGNQNNRRERRFTRRMQIKLLAVFAFVLLALIIVLLRIWQINVTNGSSYAKQVLSQNNYDSQTLYARRGEIQDTNGRLLAYSEKVYNLVLDCYAVNEREEYLEPTVAVLCNQFGLDNAELKALITDEKTRDSQYQILLKDITEEQKDAYEDYLSDYDDSFYVAGVWFEEKFVRKYPLSTVASTVIGFSNEIGDGISGLESYYDEQLKGTNGRVFGYLNEDLEYQKKTIAPENGYTLVSTIDVNIQEIVEKYIAEFDDTYGDHLDNGTSPHGAQNVGIIVMDPNSGSILAMATNSGYDLNDPQDLSPWYTKSEVSAMTEEEYVDALNEVWGNFCVSDGIEPGSVFKPVTMSSALECGAVTPEDSFYCDGGEYITDTEIHCDAYPNAHGEETLEMALVNSCNDALMQIAARMGVSNFIDYQSLFNFGKVTGIDLPNEASGAVYTKDTMNEVELATCSFGQGLTVTMVQEITAFSSVVNGGYYYQPHLVEKILDEDGRVVKNNSGLLLKQTVSEQTSDTMKQFLERAVEEGTGKTARTPGYRVGGKTGTAEKIDPETGQRADGKYLVSFIGAVPINDPQVVMYVVVDEPNVANQANSTYAQVLFRSIMLELLPYMGISATEEISDYLLSELGLTQQDIAEVDSVEVFQAYDSYGNLYSDARVEDGQVVDGSGNVVAGAYIDEEGNVYDGYMNQVYTAEEEAAEQVADNPDIAAPPEGSAGAATTTLDVTYMDDTSDSW